jgi:EAL and modified HD-GYP domain-containing signal transduction protein
VDLIWRRGGEAPEMDIEVQADPSAGGLDSLVLGWQLLVGRNGRPAGVRLSIAAPVGADAAQACLATVAGLALHGAGRLPHGLLLLAPLMPPGPSLAAWVPPRNVLLELPQAILGDEELARCLFAARRRGLRQALRLDGTGSIPSQLSFLDYAVGPASMAGRVGVPLVASDAGDAAAAQAALAGGAHAVLGWPAAAAAPGGAGGFTPSQKAVFELLRLIRMDASLPSLERVFTAEPVLAYLLLTLANSVAFRRGGPTASLGHALASIGTQRLMKWLVLLLALSDKAGGSSPHVFTALVRAHLLENLALARGRPRDEADEAFIAGAFSVLDRITGQPLGELLSEAALPASVRESVLGGAGSCGTDLALAAALEAPAPSRYPAAADSLEDGALAQALLLALAAADALLVLV